MKSNASLMSASESCAGDILSTRRTALRNSASSSAPSPDLSYWRKHFSQSAPPNVNAAALMRLRTGMSIARSLPSAGGGARGAAAAPRAAAAAARRRARRARPRARARGARAARGRRARARAHARAQNQARARAHMLARVRTRAGARVRGRWLTEHGSRAVGGTMQGSRTKKVWLKQCVSLEPVSAVYCFHSSIDSSIRLRTSID